MNQTHLIVRVRVAGPLEFSSPAYIQTMHLFESPYGLNFADIEVNGSAVRAYINFDDNVCSQAAAGTVGGYWWGQTHR